MLSWKLREDEVNDIEDHVDNLKLMKLINQELNRLLYMMRN